MRRPYRRRQEAHARSNEACADNRGIFEATSGGKKTLAKLDTSVTDVKRSFTVQQRSLDDRRAAVEACRTGRRALRDSLTAVVKVSTFVELDEGSAKVMRLPLSRATSCCSPTPGRSSTR